MNRSPLLNSLLVIVLVAVSGCAATEKTEPTQFLPNEQAIVFGKINVIVDNKPVELTTSGFSSYLTLEYRQRGSSDIKEYKIGETGYFYLSLSPGEYEILGTYGYSADVGSFDMMVPLAQRLWIPFTAQLDQSLYLGDIKLVTSKKGGNEQKIDDNYAEDIMEFKKKYQIIKLEYLKQVVELEPVDPGTFAKVTYICGRNWGVNCSSKKTGVTPISPDRFQDGIVGSTEPTLRWGPSSIRNVTYDVAIYESYDSSWQKVVLDQLTGKKRWRRGRLVTYAQDLSAPTFKPDVSLEPDSTYLWSVRLRLGDTVSTWSQDKESRIHPGAFWAFTVEQWDTWPNFTTPK